MSFRRSVFAYGSIGLVTVAGCGGTTQDRVDKDREKLDNGTPQCVSSNPTAGWASGTFPSQSAPFTLSVWLGATQANADALFGLSKGPADTYSDLAAIVRFNPQDLVDFRKGGAYAADRSLAYGANSPFSFRLDVDPIAHTYTVRQLNAAGLPLANNYAFRTEQANLGALDHFAVKVDGAGTFEACDVQVEPASACSTAVPSGGFQNHAVAAQSSLLETSFRATPNADNIDGVIGFSSAATSRFGDLAAAIRFNPGGFIDVRRGDEYAADLQIQYTAGAVYVISAMIDIAQQTYTVYLDDHTLATNYAFRPQSAAVSSLANVALVADSPVGSLSVCELTATRPADVVYVHDLAVYGPPDEGPTSFAPTAGDDLLLTTGSVTRTLDTTGRVIATNPAENHLLTDEGRNSYDSGTFSGTYDAGAGSVTSAGGTDVYVSKYDAASRPVWTRRFGGTTDDVLLSTAVDDAGDVVLLVESDPTNAGTESLIRLKTDGTTLSASSVNNASFVMARDGLLVVLEDGTDSFVITSSDATGSIRWNRTLPAQASAQFLRNDPSGALVFAGRIDGTIDFGGGHVVTSGQTESGPLAYVAKLDANGAYVYASVPDMHEPNDLFVAADGKAYLSGTHFNIDEPRLAAYGPTGNLFYSRGIELVPPRLMGIAGHVTVNPAGRIFWSFSARTGGGDSAGFLVSLQP